VNACFTTCTSDQQQFRVTVVNRGGEPARNVVVRVWNGTDEVWSESIGTVASTETVQVGPISLSPATFDPALVARVESREDCQSIGNEQPLTNALFGGEWPEPSWDADLDGHRALACGGDDCDDDDPAVYPSAPEALGEDNDCDGVVAEDIKRCATSPAWAAFPVGLAALFTRRRRQCRNSQR
jgi:MYXO-CTERM domain-containing protein